MKKMKRIISLLLVFCFMSVALCSCVAGGGDATPSDTVDMTDSKPTTSLEDDPSDEPTDAPTDEPTDAPTDEPTDEPDEPETPDEPDEPETPDEPEIDADGFVPVFRFIAASDIHITTPDGLHAQRTTAVIKGINEFFINPEFNSGYTGIDAVALAGDITENGKQEEMLAAKAVLDAALLPYSKLIITMGNHDWNTQGGNSREAFENIFGPTVSDVKIGGYHFITVLGDIRNGWDYSQSMIDEAEALIQAAIADTGPDKPVFVFEHIGNTGTAAGTCIHAVQAGHNAVSTMNEMHEKYPNLVVFSGHSHFPANDPFSIHQEHYTSINTGSLKSVISIMQLPDKTKQIQCHVVEIDAEGKLRIRHWDGHKNGFVGDTWYVDGYTPEDFVYTSDRYSKEDIFFAEDAKIELNTVLSTSAVISVPPTPIGSLPARSYKIVVKNASGSVVNSFYLDTDYYLDDRETLIPIEISNLSEGNTYTVEVYGVNAKFCTSRDNPDALLTDPLTVEFKTYSKGEEARDGANIVDLDLSGDLPANAAKGGIPVSVVGSPQIVEDALLGKKVLQVNGFNNDMVIFGSYSSFAANIKDSMSFEIYFKVDRLPTAEERTFGIASSQQIGGFGLQVDPDSTATFWIYDAANEYKKPKVNIEVGVYHHLVAVFDGSSCILYLDGEKAAAVDMSGLKLSDNTRAWYVYLGGDPDGEGGCTILSECSIAAFKLYSYDLSAEEVAEAYEKR